VSPVLRDIFSLATRHRLTHPRHRERALGGEYEPLPDNRHLLPGYIERVVALADDFSRREREYHERERRQDPARRGKRSPEGPLTNGSVNRLRKLLDLAERLAQVNRPCFASEKSLAEQHLHCGENTVARDAVRWDFIGFVRVFKRPFWKGGKRHASNVYQIPPGVPRPGTPEFAAFANKFWKSFVFRLTKFKQSVKDWNSIGITPKWSIRQAQIQGYRIWNFRVLNRGRRLGFRPLWSSLGRRDGFVRRKLGLRGSNAIALPKLHSESQDL
jgi:hypothetical protein